MLLSNSADCKINQAEMTGRKDTGELFMAIARHMMEGPRLNRVMVKLETDPFLNELNKLFERNAAKGSVSITVKHSNLVSKRHKKHAEVKEFVCLVRATDGRRKFSTEVSAKDHVRFQMAYATILKAHMGSMKKRQKKVKSRKDKETAQ